MGTLSLVTDVSVRYDSYLRHQRQRSVWKAFVTNQESELVDTVFHVKG
jgi:hypothetical protein